MGDTMRFIIEYKKYLENIESSDDIYIYNEILKRCKYDKLAIKEGLIFSYPIDKTISIIKKKFPKFDIMLGDDGDIFIECQPPDKLSEYLPLITNLGYFISNVTLDGKNWCSDFDNEAKPIAFFIEPKYDLEVTNNFDKLYHVSPLKFKNKIQRIGLVPKSMNKISKHPDRIYLMNDITRANEFGSYLLLKGEPYCIWEIDVKCISAIYSDINMRDNGFYTLSNISFRCMKLIFEKNK